MVREMKHTEIGDIPVDWELQTFEETFRILSNNTLSRENLNNRGGLVRNVHYGDILTKFSEVLDCAHDEIPYLNDISLLTSSAQLLQDGDIIIADTAEDETVGKATEISGLGDERMVAGLHTIPCRVKKGDFAPGWLGYYMNFCAYHDQVIPFVTGIKVSSIAKTALRETLIAIPSKEEQEQIVRFLSDIDEVIHNIKCEIEKLILYRKAQIQALLPAEGRNIPVVRLPGYTKSWRIATVESLADFSKGNGYSKNDLKDIGHPIILYGRLYTKYQFAISSVDTYVQMKDNSVLSKGNEVIIPASGETAEDIARAAAVLSPNIILGGDLNILRPYSYMNPMFVALSISNGTAQKELSKKGQGKSVVHIHNSDIKEITISYPEKDEQDAIVNVFLEIDGLLQIQQDKLNKYIQVKKGMMSELLTGRTRLV